jgi:O-antigen ligase
MKKFLKLAENWFILISVSFFTGNPINLLLFGGTGEGTFEEANSSFLEPLISLAIYAISLFFILMRWKQVEPQVVKRGKIILLIVFFVVGSVLWSGFPEITLRRSINFVGATFYGIYLGTRYDLNQQVKLVSWGFGVVALMSLIFGTALRKYGLMGGIHAGAWRGIYMHKNSLGIQMSLSAVIFLILLMGSDRRKWTTWAGFVLSCVLVILSRSSTAIVNLITLASLIPLCSILRFRWNFRVPIFMVTLMLLGGVSVILPAYIEHLFGALGKDMTLTGRTVLWPYVWEMIEKRPWLGYGYEGFWRGWDSESALIWRVVGWTPPHAHNGFLELLLTFGWLGTLIYLLGFFINFFKSLTLVHLNKAPQAFWPVVYLTFTILTNISEKNILAGMGWSLYVALTLLPISRFNEDFTTNRNQVDLKKIDDFYLSQEMRGSGSAIDKVSKHL